MNKFLPWLINPFIRIAGWQALILGFIGLLLMSVAGYFTGTHYYGLLRLRFAADMAYHYYLVEHILHWIILSVCLYIVGRFISSSRIRILDVGGTICIARLPLIFTSLLRFIPFFKSFYVLSAAMWILSGIHLCAATITILLLYQAYTISCNIKKIRAIVSFSIVVITSEIICWIIFYTLNL